MNDVLRRDYEACARSTQFLTDNLTDFNTGVVKVMREDFAAAVEEIEGKDAEKAGGTGETSMEFVQKGTARSVLRTDLVEISEMAIGMEPAFDGISDLFRFRRNLPDAGILALARAFYTNLADYEADFIARGFPSDFRDTLNQHADDFEASTDSAAGAKADRVGAGAALAAAVKTAMQYKESFDPIVKLKYKNDPAKRAAWISASHVEKAPKKKDPPAPPTP